MRWPCSASKPATGAVEPEPPRPGDPALLAGRVVDLDARPLADVRVIYIPDQPTLAAWGYEDISPWSLDLEPEKLAELPSTTSDADGRFELASTLVVPATATSVWENRSATRLAFVKDGLATRLVACQGYRGGERDVGDVPMGPGALVTGLVVDEQGVAIAGARVRQQGMSGTSAVGDQPGGFPGGWLSAFARTETDATGRFALRLALKARVSLRVEADELITEWLRTLDVEPGVETDVGLVTLRAGRRLVGRVRDDRGRPVVGARVWAWPRGASRSGTASATDDPLAEALRRLDDEDSVVTDDAGRFAVGRLDAERADVIVTAYGFDALRRTSVALDGRELLLELVGAASLQLDLDDGAGAPVTDAEVQAWRLPGGLQRGGRRGPELDVRADPEVPGRFVVSGLGPVSNELVVKAPARATTRLELDGVIAPARITRSLSLEAGLELLGRLVDRDGQPVTDAELSLFPPQELYATHGRLEAEPDDDGAFSFAGLSPAEWSLAVRAPGFAPLDDEHVVLSAGVDREPLQLVLEHAGSLTGWVLAPDGTPAPDQSVQAQRHREQGSRQRHATPFGTTTDPDGVFVLPGLAAAVYDVSAFPGAEASVVIEAGVEATVTLQLRQLPVLRGRVVDAQGLPVSAARVQLERRREQDDGGIDWTGRSSETTADDGAYLIKPSSPGDLWLSARHPGGGHTTRLPVTVDWGTEQVVDLAFEAGRVAGRLLDEGTGAAVAKQRLLLFHEPDGERRRSWTSTDDQGRFAFEGLQSGEYSLQTEGGGWLSGEVGRVELGPGEILDEVELVARRGATLHGRIDTLAGLPAVDRTVVVLEARDSSATDWTGSARTKDGRYTIEGIVSGTYRLRVYANRYALWGSGADEKHLVEVDLTLAPGETRQLDLTISEP